MMIKKTIPPAMFEAAEFEYPFREKYINHHFIPTHITLVDAMKISLVGEFMTQDFLGLDWRANIRADYKTPDSGDFVYKGNVIDVKTETVPNAQYSSFEKIYLGTIDDDDYYGRRLVAEEQAPHLKEKIDIIIFGIIERETLNQWYLVGWQTVKFILWEYTPVKILPKGQRLDSAAYPVKTSDLIPIEALMDM